MFGGFGILVVLVWSGWSVYYYIKKKIIEKKYWKAYNKLFNMGYKYEKDVTTNRYNLVKLEKD
ncbi:hypothetical protein ACFL0U_04020 [Pseudomonadota bacterium]